jgi:hypothetical protein
MLEISKFGQDVRQWQLFLVGQGLAPGVVDGSFGPKTRDATIEFQKKHGLDNDGVVGPKTLQEAAKLGYGKANVLQSGGFVKALTYMDKQRLFGPLTYVAASSSDNPETIKITNSWAKKLKKVEIPQLAGVIGAPKDCTVLFHEKGADKLVQLWKKWEDNDLLHFVLSWSGAWAPRFVRGSKTYLSSHAFATAFDINAQWNPLGVPPPASGAHGSVRDLVPAASELGFFWGGNFPKRPDGMHFELGEQ